mmetsp:Transcript_19660/g.58475  ORF Transcript_19660/g.58475 Transcript_19660/m.58475 type:complete len:353 (-) Transcript_19660:99-1157(-)
MARTKIYDTEVGLEKITAYCRSSKGVPVRDGTESLRNSHDTGRRVEYFRGEKLVLCLLGDIDGGGKKASKRPFTAADTEEAKAVALQMLSAGHIHRAQRVAKGTLEYDPVQKWEPRDYYVWDYEGAKGFSNFLTGCLIVGMLVCTCFPIWPHFLKVYLWYLSVTFLIFMFIFCTVRIILFLNFWVIGYDFWILPNLFDESLTFVDSFKPSYSFDPGAKGQRYYRAALLVGTVSFFSWAYNQPTDFDLFVEAQRDFVVDLYDGKLLADVSQQHKDDIDLIQRPSFEALSAEMVAEEEEEAKNRVAAEGLEKLHRQAAKREEDPEWDAVAEDAATEDMIAKLLEEETDEEEEVV